MTTTTTEAIIGFDTVFCAECDEMVPSTLEDADTPSEHEVCGVCGAASEYLWESEGAYSEALEWDAAEAAWEAAREEAYGL